jgi:hypothetical protein
MIGNRLLLSVDFEFSFCNFQFAMSSYSSQNYALTHPLTRTVLTLRFRWRLSLKLADDFLMFGRRKFVSLVRHHRCR